MTKPVAQKTVVFQVSRIFPHILKELIRVLNIVAFCVSGYMTTIKASQVLLTTKILVIVLIASNG